MAPEFSEKLKGIEQRGEEARGCQLQTTQERVLAGHPAECREFRGCDFSLGVPYIDCQARDIGIEVSYVGGQSYIPEFYDILDRAQQDSK